MYIQPVNYIDLYKKKSYRSVATCCVEEEKANNHNIAFVRYSTLKIVRIHRQFSRELYKWLRSGSTTAIIKNNLIENIGNIPFPQRSS